MASFAFPCCPWYIYDQKFVVRLKPLENINKITAKRPATTNNIQQDSTIPPTKKPEQ